MKGLEQEDPLPSSESHSEPDASTVELVGFGPSLKQSGPTPRSTVDAATVARHRRNRWIFIGSSALVVLFLFFVGPAIYRVAKSWRAQSLARSAEEEVQRQQLDEAVATVRSAYMMAPNDPEVLRAMAKTLSALNVPSAMTYWNWVLGSSSATVVDRREAAECALQLGLYNQAGIIIQELLAADEHSASNLLLAARYFSLSGAESQAVSYATRAVASDPNYKPAVIFLAVQELGNNYLRQAGIDSLLKVADGDDAFALLAIERLAQEPNLKPDDLAHALNRLEAHPMANEAARITELVLRIRQDPTRHEALLDQAVAAHADSSTGDLHQFGAWLNSVGESKRVLTLIPKDKALANKDLFLIYLDAMGELKDWTGMKALLTGNKVPLELPYLELYLFRCAREMGDTEGAELHWRSAEVAASHNARQSLYLASYAEQLGDKQRAEPIYRMLTKDLMAGRSAYLGLLRVDAGKDTTTIRDLLDEMTARWPDDEAIVNDDVYYNLLLDTRVPQMYNEAVALAKADIYSAPHLTDVALAYLRLHNAARALQVFNESHIHWQTAAPSTLVVYAAALQANDRPSEASQAVSSIQRDTLRPEEAALIKDVR